MNKILVTIVLLISANASAQLSTKLQGSLSSYEYSSQQSGFLLEVTGSAAEVLYKSIEANGGIRDSMSSQFTEDRTNLQSTATTIYSDSMACTKTVTPTTQVIKIKYVCEVTITKKGKVVVPPRG
jgi:hypothetical protein